MKRITVTANDMAFTCLICGDGPRLALLLHGFPDDPGTWRPLMAKLADEGFTVVAPWMRGYGPTGLSSDDKYRVPDFGADAVALVEALGYETAVLVGHDWGAFAAYMACNLAPHRFSHLIAMSLPPFRTILPNLLRHPAQLRRFLYIFAINLPGSVARCQAENLALVERLWARWSPGWVWPPERLAEVKETLSAPGALRAAFSYYWEVLRRLPLDVEHVRYAWGVGAAPISVPAVVLCGSDDGCVAPEAFDGIERAFAGPIRFEVIQGAGHFLTLEAPDEIWDLIAPWLAQGHS